MDYELSQSKVEKSRQFLCAYTWLIFTGPVTFVVVTHTQVPILKILINALKVNKAYTQANTKVNRAYTYTS